RLDRWWSDPIYPHSVHPVRSVCICVGRWYRFRRRAAASTDCSHNIIVAGQSEFPLCPTPSRRGGGFIVAGQTPYTLIPYIPAVHSAHIGERRYIHVGVPPYIYISSRES